MQGNEKRSTITGYRGCSQLLDLVTGLVWNLAEFITCGEHGFDLFYNPFC